MGGPPGQPDYLNAALALDTDLSPSGLLADLLAVEARAGRVRAERWGPRVLDLDLIAHGDAVLDSPGLTLPHPRAFTRAFVLAPLAEVAPDWQDPRTGLGVQEALARLDAGGVTPLEGNW